MEIIQESLSRLSHSQETLGTRLWNLYPLDDPKGSSQDMRHQSCAQDHLIKQGKSEERSHRLSAKPCYAAREIPRGGAKLCGYTDQTHTVFSHSPACTFPILCETDKTQGFEVCLRPGQLLLLFSIWQDFEDLWLFPNMFSGNVIMLETI